jgi:hypothetical protein
MKAIMRHLAIFSAIFFCTCSTNHIKSNPKQEKVSESKTVDSSFYAIINRQFNLIDSIKQTDNFEKADTLADEIVSIIEKNRDAILILPDTLNYDFLYVSKSFDKNFCLVSWDTRKGGTMIDFGTIAIYKTNSGIKSKYLYDSTSEMCDTYMHYDTIYTIKSFDNKSIYLAQGFGQGSTALPWQEIRAFGIDSDTLTCPNIFSDTRANVFVEFDTHKFKDDELVPNIKLNDFGKTIIIPIATEEEGFSGKYETLIFNDTTFINK